MIKLPKANTPEHIKEHFLASKFKMLIYDTDNYNRLYNLNFLIRIFKKFTKKYNIENQEDAVIVAEFKKKYIKHYLKSYLHDMLHNKIFLSKACYFELTKNKHGPLLSSDIAYKLLESSGLPIPRKFSNNNDKEHPHTILNRIFVIKE